jgi:hypothetical protein
MARLGRELAVAHDALFTAEGLLGDLDSEFLEVSLPQIDQPPNAHPCNAGTGPFSIIPASAWPLAWFSLQGWPGALPS